MMRNNLYHRNGEVERFTAIISDTTRSPRRIVLRDVFTEDGEWIADHVWVPVTKEWKNIRIYAGARVKFTGRFKLYHRADRSQDMGIESLTRIRVNDGT